MDAKLQESSSVEEGEAMGGAVSGPPKPRLGIFKFASCSGCQGVLVNCEDELLSIAGAVDIVHFPEASSHLAEEGPFDVALVEGSISAPEHLEQIQDIR